MPFLGLTEDLMLNDTGADMQGVAGGDATEDFCAGMPARISSNGFAKETSLSCPTCSVLLATAQQMQWLRNTRSVGCCQSQQVSYVLT